MGLDGVELVMEIEEEFGIELSQSECMLMETVEDIVTVIEAKLSPTHLRDGAASRLQELAIVRHGDRVKRQVPLFYRVRQILSDSLLVEKRLIRPDTDLRRLIPGGQRVLVWQDLRDAGFSLPALGWSWLAWFTGLMGCLAVAAVAFVIAAQFALSIEWIIILATPMLFVGWLSTIFGLRWMGRSGMLPRLCSNIPESCATPARIVEFHAPSVASPQPLPRSDPPGSAAEAVGEQVRSASEALGARLEFHLTMPCSMLQQMTRLADVIPPARRFTVFEALRAEGMPVPELASTAHGRLIAAAATAFVAIAASALCLIAGRAAARLGTPEIILWSLSGVLLLIVLIVSAIAWDRVMASFRRRRLWRLHGEIPAEWATMERAATWLAMCEWPAKADDPGRVRIIQRVREIVASLTGAPIDRVGLGTRLADLLD